MKIVLSSILCILSSYVGFYISNTLKKEKMFLKDWLDYTNVLIREISFSKHPIGDITKNYISNKKGEFVNLLNEYLIYINNTGQVSDLAQLSDKKYISKRNKGLITAFFKSLGTIDYNSQIFELKGYYEAIQEIYTKAKKDYKSKGTLFFKLGLLLGIAIMILLV